MFDLLLCIKFCKISFCKEGAGVEGEAVRRTHSNPLLLILLPNTSFQMRSGKKEEEKKDKKCNRKTAHKA